MLPIFKSRCPQFASSRRPTYIWHGVQTAIGKKVRGNVRTRGSAVYQFFHYKFEVQADRAKEARIEGNLCPAGILMAGDTRLHRLAVFGVDRHLAIKAGLQDMNTHPASKHNEGLSHIISLGPHSFGRRFTHRPRDSHGPSWTRLASSSFVSVPALTDRLRGLAASFLEATASSDACGIPISDADLVAAVAVSPGVTRSVGIQFSSNVGSLLRYVHMQLLTRYLVGEASVNLTIALQCVECKARSIEMTQAAYTALNAPVGPITVTWGFV
ncbi:hypothetical protein FB451DRAFT_1192452 [Mycena latifolia]|nr:hypothetical protein FB451DRAFT_1192452 [Mycena latifolia]